jgi:hypothetical protein
MDVKERLKAEVAARVRAEKEPKVRIDLTKAKSEVNRLVPADTLTRAKSEMKAQFVEAQVKAESDLKARWEAQAEARWLAAIEAQVEAEMEAKAKAEAKIKAQLKTETSTQVKSIGAKSEVNATQVEPESTMNTRLNSGPATKVKTDSEMKTRLLGEIEIAAKARIQAQRETSQ